MVIWSDPRGIHVAFDGIEPSRDTKLRIASWWERKLRTTERSIKRASFTFAYKVFATDPDLVEYGDDGAPELAGESGFGTEHLGPPDGVEIPLTTLIQSGIDSLRHPECSSGV